MAEPPPFPLPTPYGLGDPARTPGGDAVRPIARFRIDPYLRVDGLPWTLTRHEALARWGSPQRQGRNAVGLDELDYGDRVLRFQIIGRLEEVTRWCEAVQFGDVVIPVPALDGFIRAQDADCFVRAGFLVSPLYGLAFVPGDAPWVTALAEHCIDSWRALRPSL
jgi:hypothetical protein